MALMFPEKCEINETDREYQIFNALKYNLDDDYRVYHSFNSVYINRKRQLETHEIDFVVFHPKKGILVIEAKNGRHISYDPKKDLWLYSDKTLIHKGIGPFKQVQNNERFLRNLLVNEFGYDLKCRFGYAVWFHAMSQKQIDNLPIRQGEYELIIPQEGLEHTNKYIEKIYSYFERFKTELSPSEIRKITNLLEVEFDVESDAYEGLNYNKYIFKRLSDEQARILDFLDEQKTAAINGAAGTGKTFVAIEKAKKCASLGENVLFLCFTRELRDKLAQDNKSQPLIDFKTIDKLAFELDAVKINTQGKKCADMQRLIQKIQTDEFAQKYQHVIIDEAQDFGQKRMESSDDETSQETGVVEALYEITQMQDGTFYLFYDKNQKILSQNLPKYIKEAECKITLHKNCRNTRHIAITSTRVLENFKPNVEEHFVDDRCPEIYIETNFEDRIKILDKIISDFKNNFSKDIVILSCSDMNRTEMRPYINEVIIPKSPKNDYEKKVYRYKNETRFYTCATFKGLEADAVILVDVCKEHFINKEKRLNFYTGASRARAGLAYICNLTNDDCTEIVKTISPRSYTDELPIKSILADIMNSELS